MGTQPASRKHNPAPARDDDPVIVAYGVVAPGARGPDALGRFVASGRCAIQRVAFDGLGEVPVGRVDGFDSPLNLSGQEDRSITMLRECHGQVARAWTALADLVPPERRAVAAATSKGALLAYLNHPSRRFHMGPRLWAGDPAARLAGWCGAGGPNEAFVGACATGLANITRACEYILDDQADIAIAGSTEATLHPLYLSSFQNLGALSPNGCFPYDARHDGFIAAEGAALFVIARRSLAQRAGQPPIARLAGWAGGSDAFHPVGIDPSGATIAATIRRALRQADCSPDDIDWTSGHGTGTIANDTAEANALRAVFAGTTPRVHSFKGAVGHTMGAAGSVELAAMLAAMESGILPPTVGFAEHAPECAGLDVRAQAEERQTHRALKLSFGFGGHILAAVVGSAAG